MTDIEASIPGVVDRLRRMAADDVVERMWAGDHTVWKDDPTEIADRLGWLAVAGSMRERLPGLEAFAGKAAADGLTTAVLLGMGGSSLAPETFAGTFGGALLDLVVLDTTHPDAVRRAEASLDLDGTLFVVASKSGTTIETRSHEAYFWDRTGGAGDRFVAITDPGSPLERLGREKGYREVFLNPEDIGGRYSALSLFGLVPAALIGAPLQGLVDAAEGMAERCRRPPEENPGARLGAALGEAALAGRDKLTLILPPEIASLGAWVEQLVAESTGKQGTGVLPVVDEPLGPPEVYHDDRLFVAYGEGLADLEEAGHPVIRLPDPGAAGLGAELFRWEMATAIAGHVLGINPFDQPNVAEAKEATKEVLDSGGGDGTAADDARTLLGSLRAGDYAAILGFLDPTQEHAERLQRARLAIRDRRRVATTLGFGPRYLHSTGQLHKGGPDTGVFLQVVDSEREHDVPIPGAPYTFGGLIDAQALGDLRALGSRGRRVARVTLEMLEGLAEERGSG